MESLNEEIGDIIECILKFDDTESLEVKGRYFEVIQRDLRKAVGKNTWDDVYKKIKQTIIDKGMSNDYVDWGVCVKMLYDLYEVPKLK